MNVSPSGSSNMVSLIAEDNNTRTGTKTVNGQRLTNGIDNNFEDKMDKNTVNMVYEERSNDLETDIQVAKVKSTIENFRQQVIWPNFLVMLAVHIGAFYALFLLPSCRILTIVQLVIMHVISAVGVTAGPHRLWSHRSYKAKWPLRLLLFVMYTSAGQSSIFHWSRDHRIHHKYAETDADPHNGRRGFWFSHVGWLVTKKHPEVIKKGRQVDMSDILADPIASSSNKIFYAVMAVWFIGLPIIPVYFWNETWKNAIMSQMFFRYAAILNATWSVNSFAHMYGSKPYDKNIYPAENFLVSVASCGEGWHNYHHVFPWDYRATELNILDITSATTLFIEFFHKIGWAYDLKQPSTDLVKKTAQKRGDKSHPHWAEEPEPVETQ